jgi:hypothetical protein
MTKKTRLTVDVETLQGLAKDGTFSKAQMTYLFDAVPGLEKYFDPIITVPEMTRDTLGFRVADKVTGRALIDRRTCGKFSNRGFWLNRAFFDFTIEADEFGEQVLVIRRR